MKKIVKFLGESMTELKKVVWPSRDSVVSSTKLVLISTVLFALFFWLADFLFVQAINIIF